jgi:hypothetical protein
MALPWPAITRLRQILEVAVERERVTLGFAAARGRWRCQGCW